MGWPPLAPTPAQLSDVGMCGKCERPGIGYHRGVPLCAGHMTEAVEAATSGALKARRRNALDAQRERQRDGWRNW